MMKFSFKGNRIERNTIKMDRRKGYVDVWQVYLFMSHSFNPFILTLVSTSVDVALPKYQPSGIGIVLPG